MIESMILALTYDKIIVKCERLVTVTDEDTGISKRKKIEISVPEGEEKCAISKKDLQTLNGDTPQIVSKRMLFAYPYININPGDILTIKDPLSNTKTVWESGDPFFYYSHTEIPIEAKERF